MCSESAHGHCLVGFVFKRATHGIRCSSSGAGSYQTALHYSRLPVLNWGELLFVIKAKVYFPLYAQSCQIRSEDLFVTINLKDAYFYVSILPTHRKFLRFAFGGEAYQYRVLPFGLALLPRTFTKCVSSVAATGHQHTQLH